MCRGIWRQSAARFLARFSAGSGKLERRPAIKFCRNFERVGRARSSPLASLVWGHRFTLAVIRVPWELVF